MNLEDLLKDIEEKLEDIQKDYDLAYELEDTIIDLASKVYDARQMLDKAIDYLR